MAADVIVEEVPKFTRRYGDQVFEGSNNTIIILGTDRAKKGPATIDDGLGHVDADEQGKGTGAIHIIAGRAGKDPNFSDDKAFLYLGMKTKVDTNLDLDAVENAPDPVKTPAAVLKSDCVRIVGRKDIKICANDDTKHYMFMDGKKIKFKFDSGATMEIVDKKITIKMGSNVIEMDDKKAHIDVSSTKFSMDGTDITCDGPHFKLKGGAANEWRSLFNTVMFMIANHGHMTVVGPSLPAGLSPAAITPSALGPVAPGPHPITTAQWPTAISKLVELGQNCFG